MDYTHKLHTLVVEQKRFQPPTMCRSLAKPSEGVKRFSG